MEDDGQEQQGSGGMKKLIAGLTLVLLLAVAVRVYLIWRERRDAATVTAPATPDYHVTADDLVVPRKQYASSMKDVRALDGHRIWVFAAGQMKFYPATASHLDYAHPQGLLLGAEPLDVSNFIEQAAPATMVSNIPHGDRQVVMLFHRGSEPARLYGTPVGYLQDGSYNFYMDEAFFYDDPHALFKHWSQEQWKAIDEHRAIAGMSERQVNLALGQVSTPGPGSVGNRTVVYDNQGHPVTVTYANNRATKVEQGT